MTSAANAPAAVLNFDYKPDDVSSYYLRTLYSRYKDTETRNSTSIEFANPKPLVNWATLKPSAS